jgi:LCP family protein required for cell wall assembly
MIPGHGIDKINAAYSLGGPDLTARTLKLLFGDTLKINHIININFRGFRQAVDAVGCVYADIDRRYYHSNVGLPVSQHYAEINVQPGYQRLCGQRALDYVRFRHADSDLVRAARQQDFLRAAKDQLSTSSLIGDRDALIKIFNRNTQTDTTLRSVPEVIKLAKLAIFSSDHPVAQIKFPGIFTGDAKTGDFVEASPATIARVRDEFFHASPPAKKAGAAKPRTSAKARRKADAKRVADADLVSARGAGEGLVAATVRSGRPGLRVYFPAKLTPQGRYTTVQPSPRVYTIRDRAGREHDAYRLVVVQNESQGEYYGIQGTDWTAPPVLAHPTSTTTINGRRLSLYKTGNRLRYVAWRHGKAVYWVSNTLTTDLTNGEMLGIAASLTHLPSH